MAALPRLPPAELVITSRHARQHHQNARRTPSMLTIAPALAFASTGRMHLARRALARANPSATTVTAIATALGFWVLGRFSLEYRALFGELPKETLTKPR
jgi:AraC-like DNA-binding protein